jgi:hypothetical protein
MKSNLKTVIILSFLSSQIGIFKICNAQNLVLNGNFEDTLNCPTRAHDFKALTNWINPSSGTPNFFHKCDTEFNSEIGVPINWLGYQQPRSGSGYLGIYLRHTKGHIYREYIEGKLLNTLVANNCYHFEMFINLGNRCRYTTDNIGIYFSDTLYKISNHGEELPFKPQISNIQGNIMDTLTWLLVSGDYISQGRENYIIIGNFKSDPETNSIIVNPGGLDHIYCYIDDVSLTEYLPCNTSAIDPIKSIINVFPNPVLDELNIFIENNELTELILFDITLRTLIKQTFRGNISLSTNQLKTGVYYYQVKNGNNLEVRGKILKG